MSSRARPVPDQITRFLAELPKGGAATTLLAILQNFSEATNQTTPAPASFQTISTSLTPVGTRRNVHVQGSITGLTSGMNDTVRYELYVDGALSTSAPYLQVESGGANGNTGATLGWLFEGLSAGAHTFAIRATNETSVRTISILATQAMSIVAQEVP